VQRNKFAAVTGGDATGLSSEIGIELKRLINEHAPFRLKKGEEACGSVCDEGGASSHKFERSVSIWRPDSMRCKRQEFC